MNNKIDKELLKDGNVLCKLIDRFNDDKNQNTYISVISCLCDSDLFIPVDTEEEIDEDMTDAEILDLIGDEKIDIDILKSGSDLYFPLFAREDEFNKNEDYAGKHKLIRLPFLDCINLCKTSNGVKNIVVDPFSHQFEINEDNYLRLEEYMRNR